MIKVGILFGGKSREREISFAGGRTVYDALDKSIFEPVPIFIDGLGHFIKLDWKYIYKGTIRDFFPPSGFVPNNEQRFQVYSESLGEKANNPELLKSIGEPIVAEDLGKYFDIAFLALHGPYGEDGYLQGLLDYYEIPYTGSGVFPSSIGISKALQKKLMNAAGTTINKFVSFTRTAYENDAKACYKMVADTLAFPVVIKASSQGSSIGVHFLENDSFDEFNQKVSLALFKRSLNKEDWSPLNAEEKDHLIGNMLDLQHGLGLPVYINNDLVHYHSEAIETLDDAFETHQMVRLRSLHGEHRIVVEEKLSGKEFSCIVVRDKNQKAIALPPTEIRKKQDFFDYRSKYLPGITRKVTPIEIDAMHIESIRASCVELFNFFEFDTYARIDGFIDDSGTVFLNDPNTTSGMMPSSFFFHQAAEVGLNPTQFLTYILHQSLIERKNQAYHPNRAKGLIRHLEQSMSEASSKLSEKPKVAVIFGGYSSERHISVESGRNVFEKLSSSGLFETIPIFLSQDEHNELSLHKVPINLLLKDNADDIKDKIVAFKIDPVIDRIIEEANDITGMFAADHYDFYPRKLSLPEMAEQVDFAFMALHGRPGEDGQLPELLEAHGIPYNGSSPRSSSITIDKYQTNEILLKNGVLVAKHQMVWKDDWEDDSNGLINQIEKEYGYPLIAKPADDGCSSAVKKVNSREELIDFTKAIFRVAPDVDPALCKRLGLKLNEEFPIKQGFLIEELIGRNGANHFLEITGGMLIRIDDEGKKVYEVFESSEAVAEGGILSLEEKFLAGEGQNITPARYATNPTDNNSISSRVKSELAKTADLLNVEGYCRIDAFVRIFSPEKVEVIVIEINSLPGLTPATAIFHQAALANYKPAEFLEQLIKIGTQRKSLASA